MLLRARLVLTGLTLLATVVLASCSSGSPGSSTSTKTTSSAATHATTTTGGRRVVPASVASALQKGLASATSAHLAVSTTLSGQALTGNGDATLTRGAIKQARLQQDLPSGLGTISVIVTGDKTYAKLPSALRTNASKPWVLLTSDSKSVVVSQLAATIQPILTVASPASLITFTRAASSVTDLGAQTIGSTATTHYRVVVDATKLPASIPSSITAGGKSSIPIDMYLDATGRPLQITGTFSISGQTVTPTIMLTNYNAAVTVTAPPPDQVSAR